MVDTGILYITQSQSIVLNAYCLHVFIYNKITHIYQSVNRRLFIYISRFGNCMYILVNFTTEPPNFNAKRTEKIKL